jgi:threonyl-tRNA synthetase
MYNPLVGGVPVIEGLDTGAVPTAKPKNSTSGRPTGATSKASRKDIQSTVYEIEAFMSASQSFASEKYKVKKLNKQQKDSVTELCKKIIASSTKDAWVSNLQKCMADLDELEKLNPLQEILDTANEFLLDEYSAAIWHHSTVK